MMKHEFEALAKRAVTDEQFDAIEKLYMSSDLDKRAFVKSIRPMLKSIPEPESEKKIVLIGVPDNSGYYITPNGCWHHTILAELVDISIATGKYTVRKIEKSYELRGVSAWDLYRRDTEVEFVA